MRYFPVELDVMGREVLVVGATGEVVSKVDRLLSAGAKVVVVASGEIDPGIDERAQDGRISLLRREAALSDMDGKALVYVATTEDHRAKPFFEQAAREGRPLCTIDRPELSTFVNPAIVRAQGMTMSFSTGGTSPGALRRIREDLEAIFSDPRYGRFLEALKRLREGLPRGERAARLAEAVKGFGLAGALRFPEWFERGEEP